MSSREKNTFSITDDAFTNFVEWIHREDEALELKLTELKLAEPDKLASPTEKAEYLGEFSNTIGRKEELMAVSEELGRLAILVPPTEQIQETYDI